MRPTVRRISIFGLFLACFGGIQAVQAAPVGYSINFLPTFAGNAATGTFSYDANGGVFADFLVDWEGYTFDLTSAANNPLIGNGGPLCLGGSVGGAATFEALAGACGPADVPFWTANTFFGVYYFTFKVSDDDAGSSLSVTVLGPATDSIFGGGGIWAVTPVPSQVPEPTTFAFALSGLLCVALLAPRRRRTKAARLS